MKKKADVIVIGGSAAGITAAITSRRHYPDKSVILIRREEKVLIPCGIPYIFGTVGIPENNLISDGVFEKNGIELIIEEVTGIDREKRTVTLSDGNEAEYEKLVIAAGSRPFIPRIPGVDRENIFVVEKNVSYLRNILEKMKESKNLVIVGGGFIGAEFADECSKNKELSVTIVEMLEHCLIMTFDKELCIAAEDIKKDRGIKIIAPGKVVSFTGNSSVEGVKLDTGQELKADIVILGIGCAANTELAKKAGLPIGPTGGIEVNRFMQTIDENIFACGDCVEKVSFFDGKPSNLKLASIATREARIAGANLFDVRRQNYGVIGVLSTVLGDTAFALAGLSENEAKRKGYSIVVGESEGMNRHPGGMPEAANMKVKLIFERKSGVILGGEIMGAKAGGELINTLSACIHQKMTVEDIAIFPAGTHPALTASPVAYQLTNAAEMACKEMVLN